jgi:pseudaminic acid biosynthesis-associated methylase
MSSEQEVFWQEEFGDNYTIRNNENTLLANNIELFNKIFLNLNDISNVLELGCNRGNNLEAIHSINKNILLNGIDINKSAIEILNNKNICQNTEVGSIYNIPKENKFDLVFTKGVLIHIPEDKLSDVLEIMYECSKKYILICEYYSKNRHEINYRNFSNKLWKDDFCGKIMQKYNNLEIVDYGFSYHKDPKFPLDDITWFLLKKC